MATSTTPKEKHMQMRKRGFWLKAYLYLILFTLSPTTLFLSWIFIALIVRPQFQHAGSLGLSNLWWELILDIISIAGLICIVGIWYWKKWGVYGIFCIQILGMLYSFIGIYRYYSYSLVAFAVNVFWCVVIILVFRPYWHSLD